jgi:hypothetical protein
MARDDVKNKIDDAAAAKNAVDDVADKTQKASNQESGRDWPEDETVREVVRFLP